MSEGYERNLEGAAPEAAENIQEQQPDQPETPEVENASDLDDRENAPRPSGGEPEKEEKGKGRGVAKSLVIVLLALFLFIGVFVGIRLGRNSGANPQEEENAAPEEEAQDAFDAAEEIPAYDGFTEELTGENQRALDALAGEDGFFDEGANALMGEDGLFGAEAPDGEPAGEPVVVAEFGDGQQLMSDEVLEEYSNQLSIYILSGYSEAEVAETLLDSVLHTMVGQRVLEQHARELGLYELSDEDRAELEAQAADIFDQYLAYYRESVVNTEGMTEEEAIGAAKAYLLDFQGITYDSICAELEATWWEQKIYAQITDSVTVDDAAVQAAYDARLAEQKQTFGEYPYDYEFSQINGELIVYNLPGYRAVKMLMLGFDSDETAMNVFVLSDELAAIDGEEDDHLQEHQQELDAYYAEPEARATEALEQLRAGANMDELILTIGTDAGMMDERQRAMGYYVSADSMFWPEPFVSAAMALENVGDYSEPVRTLNGVCILQYLGEVPAGDVPLADVRAILEQETLAAAQYEAYEAQVQAWVEEANPSFYPERMQ